MDTIQFIIGLLVLIWGIGSLVVLVAQFFLFRGISDGDRQFNRIGNLVLGASAVFAVLITGAGVAILRY